MSPLKIGLFGIGLDAYWPQFPGLKERLESYLQPGPAIDYAEFNRMNDRTRMTGEWLAYCAACPVPEIVSVFNRARFPFHQVTGMLDDDPTCWDAVAEWIEAARVAQVMEHNRLGLMGIVSPGTELWVIWPLDWVDCTLTFARVLHVDRNGNTSMKVPC